MQNESCPICDKNEIVSNKYSRIKDPYDSISGEFHYNKCLNCGNLYLANPIKEENISKAYPKSYGAYKKMNLSKLRNSLISFQAKKLLKNFPGKKLKILEVGAGEGIYSKFFKRLGHEVTATDIDEESMRKLEELNIKVKIGDFYNIRFNEKFDLIVMSHIIEHFYNPKKVVEKLKTLLDENGIIYIKTPNSDFLFLDKLKKNTYVFDAPRHINIFSKKALKILFEEKGFKVKVKDEFTLNEFINYFKIKYKDKLRLPYVVLIAILSLPLASLAYFTKKSSRMAAIAK